MEFKKEIEQLVSTVISEGASDLHLSEGRNPVVRVSGTLIPLVKSPVTTSSDMKGYINEFLSEDKKIRLAKNKDIDFSYSLTDVRFRGNAYYQQDKLCIALRLIPHDIRTLAELNLPPILETFTRRPQGFFPLCRTDWSRKEHDACISY
jgi:twitching motility protein PilT